MPFTRINDKSIEVEIRANNITYSEIGTTHYGLQVNYQSKNAEITDLVKEGREKGKGKKKKRKRRE